MGVRVVHTIGDLESDFRKMAAQAPIELRKVVRKNAIEGNRLAKSYAKASAGKHGKHYHRAFTWEMDSYYGFGGGNITAEYGPQIDRPQGGMSFEHGSRNQKPHLDLNRSADVIAWQFGPNVLYAAHNLFWPGS